jgi:hypothetical protein
MIGYLSNAVYKDVIKKGKYRSFVVGGIQMLVDNIFDLYQTFASISSMQWKGAREIWEIST